MQDIHTLTNNSNVVNDINNNELTKVIDHRPFGSLPAITEKIVYYTYEGKQTIYITVSFLPVEIGDKTYHRPIEFFMPVGRTGESQQWITATMRSLSLAARGGFLAKALADLRKVAWDKGPIRLGTITKDNGSVVSVFHDSEVAAIAFAIEQIIERYNGKTVVSKTEDKNETATEGLTPMAGKKCPECGAYGLIKKDGCSFCTYCGYVGSCG